MSDEAAKHKKRKKDKSHADGGSSKKRKGEEVEAEQDAAPDTTATGKKKKKKRRYEDDAEQSQQDAAPPSPPTTKKKSKKHKSTSQPKPTTSAPSQPTEGQLFAENSPFITQTTSLYLPLSPCASDFPLQGLCAEHLSPLLLTYSPPLKGVVLAYSDARMHSNKDLEIPESRAVGEGDEDEVEEVLAKCIDEYAPTFLWLTATFLLFRPAKGTWIEGWISLQNESFLGLVCYNYFNAVVERDKLPVDWRWVNGEDHEEGEDEDMVGGEYQGTGGKGMKKMRRKGFGEGSGYFVDGEGEKVKGRMVFKVEDFEASSGVDGTGGSVSIVGTLLPEDSQT